MISLPDDVRAALVQAVGAYLGRAPAQDLPKNVRRLKGFRPKALSRHGDELLGLLEDEIQRKLILQALDDDALRLSKRTEQVARLALERDEGWEEKLAGMSETSAAPAPEPGRDLEAELARERRKVKEAREEARRAKASARAEVGTHLKRTEELERQVFELESQLEQARTLLALARSETAANLADMQRQARKLQRDAAKAKAERAEAKSETKALRKELTRQAGEPAAAERARPRAQRAAESPAQTPPPEVRVPLSVPMGLFAEAAETLDLWLGEPRISLLVDGYNVSKTEAGFGALSLEHQRTRLIDEIDRLARTRKLPATIVFDGAAIGPGTSRRARRAVEVVYSRPPESADDHLVALLESLPKNPVVVVTNDRELQERCVERGATIARAEQLLSLIR